MALDYSPGSYTAYNPRAPIILPPVQAGVQPAPVTPTVANYATGSYQAPQSPAQSNTYEEVSENPWFANTEDSNFLDDVWDWAKTDQGTSVIGGAISGIGSMVSAGWADDTAKDGIQAKKELLQMELDARERMQTQALAASEAVLKNARIAKHNTSINRPVSLRLKK